MRAICTTCGRDVEWRAHRGARLADHRCPCGGQLKAPPRTGGTTRGQHFRICDYCGRRKLETRMVRLSAATWLIRREMPAGSVVCYWHEVAEDGGYEYVYTDGVGYKTVTKLERERSTTKGVTSQ